MEPYAVKFTDDSLVGEPGMWADCNYIYKCEGEWQRFLIMQATTDLRT